MDIRVYLTNLGKYNEDELLGGWLNLPFDDIDLEELKREIGINERYEEWFITDYEAPFKIGEYDSLYDLNQLVIEINELDEYEQTQFEILLEEIDIQNALEYAINGNYWIVDNCDNEDDLGRYIVDNGLLGVEIPEELEHYIDYEAIGEEWAMDAYKYSNGYIFLK